MNTTPFLNIELKEDSADKLAKTNGKPTKNYIFSPEFNSLVSGVNVLRTLIRTAEVNLSQIINSTDGVDLGTIELPIWDFLNNSASQNIVAPKFYRYILDEVTYVYAFVGTNGIYGTGAELVLVEGDFLLIYQSDVDVAVVPDKFYYAGKLFQAGTAIPTVTELANPHEIAPLLYRIGTGRYKISLDMINWSFIVDGQRIQFFLSGSSDGKYITWQLDAYGVVDIQVRDLAGNYVDGLPANGVDFYFKEI